MAKPTKTPEPETLTDDDLDAAQGGFGSWSETTSMIQGQRKPTKGATDTSDTFSSDGGLGGTRVISGDASKGEI